MSPQLNQTGKLTTTAPVRKVLVNSLTVFASLLVFGLLCEFVVFRFILPASDIPENAFIDGIVKYKPKQEGVYLIRNEISAPFRINANGWNSVHSSYPITRDSQKQRIVVIGDSYVEALQVPYDASFAELLERELGPGKTEVFRFGISGAPLSQYLQVFEREAAGYAPHLAVFVLVHNDFDESFLFNPGRYTSSFLKLSVENGVVVKEIPPRPYQITWLDWLRQTATLRYLYYRQQLSLSSVKRTLMSLVSRKPPPQHGERQQYQANVDVAAVRRHADDIQISTDYLFRRIKNVAQTQGIRLLFVMDGVRAAIYAGTEDEKLYQGGALKLNRLAQKTAKNHSIAFIQLQPVFAADFAANGQRFEFEHDGHWNSRGHQIVAKAIAENLKIIGWRP